MKYLIYSKISKHFLLLCLSLIMTAGMFAQQYPVNVNANVLTPMPSKLTNFYTDNTQKLFVILTNKDLANPSIPVKLKLTLKSATTQIVSRVGSEIGISPILLDAGVPKTLTQQDLAPYFNINNLDFVGGFSKSQYTTSGVLPEGNYAICIQVLDYYNNRPLSNPFCTYGSIFFSQPPNLLTPLSNNVISGQNNKVINFNWTPNHLNNRDVIAGGYKYMFTLKELLDSTQNINQAYVTANTRLTEEVTNNQFILNTMTTPLISGRKYAWTVQVKANNPEAQSTLSNDGISQIFGFTYDDNCLVPKNVIANISRNKATISWQNVTGSTITNIKYKEVNGVEYVKNILPNTNSITLEELNYQTAYEFNMTVQCGSNMIVLDSRQFRVPAKPIAQKMMYKNKVYWSVKEGSQGDYTGTGFQLKTIFQGVSDKTLEKAIPNNKFGLKTKLNDTTVTMSNSSGIIAEKKLLSGAKITLFENGEPLQSVIANANGEFEMPIDTEKIMENQHLRYYVRYELPNQQYSSTNIGYIAPDSILLSGMRSGSDILKALNGREIVLASSDYTIIHPVVYVGQNQSTALHRKAGGEVEVFIKTDNKSALNRRVLGFIDNNQGVESYNGDSYVRIGTLNDSKAFLPILRLNDNDKLLFKVILKDNPTQLYPLSILPKNGNMKILNIPLDYNPFVTVQGKVYKNPQKQLEGLNKSGVTAYIKTTNTAIDATTTNSDGSYALLYVPFSQVNNIIVNAAPFNETTKKVDNTRASDNYSFNALKATETSKIQDITYDKQAVDIIYGQAISSESKKALSEVTILYGDIRVGTTTEDGFFAFKLNASQRDPSKFKIVCDGRELDSKQTTQFIQRNFGEWEKQAKLMSYSKSDNNINKPNSALLNNLITKSKDFSDSSKRTISVLLDTTKEVLGSYYLANVNISEILRYKLTVTLRGVKQNIVLYDLQREQSFKVNPKDTTFYFDVTPRQVQERYIFYTVLDTTKPFRPLDPEPANIKKSYVPLRKVLVMFSKSASTATLVLSPIIKIKGIIKDNESNKIIDSVSVEAEKLNATTATNTKGEYEVSFTETDEVKLLISKKGYFSKDTIVKIGKLIDNAFTVNANLKKTPNGEISQMSGFKIKITSQQYIQDTTYKISGSLEIEGDNDIFKRSNDYKTLTFKNIEVRVNTKGNAIPVIDSVTFAETQINATMFDFAPVVVNKVQLRRKNDGSPFTEGAITGIVTLKTSTFKSANKSFPFDFGDATLKIPDNWNFIYVFAINKRTIKAFDDKNIYYLRFDQPGQSAGVVAKPVDKEGYVKNPILKGQGSVNTHKDSCFISKTGITLTGSLGLPNSFFTGNSGDTKSNVSIDFGKIEIDKQLKVKDVTVDLSKKPFDVNLSKWMLRIQSIKLLDFDAPDKTGLGFGGKLYLTKPDDKDTTKNVLKIKTFEIRVGGSSNLEVLAKFIPPPGDINIKSLKFTPSQKNEIELGYTEKDGFIFKCAGKITSSDSTSSMAKVTKKIFPLEVEEFSIKSKNFAVFASLKPSTKIDFKGVNINITKAVLNVGRKMHIDDMNKYLLGTQSVEEPPATPDAFDPGDSDVAWAFGVSGSVDFGKGGENMKTQGEVKTSFIVGEFNNKIDFRINDVSVELKTPTAEIKAKVKFKLTGDSIGIAGAGKLKLGGFELDTAAFHFYKIKDKDVALGAMLRVPVNGFTTGPISWYSLGGGFSFNSASNSIEAYFSGTAGPAGTTKITTMGYVDIEKLGIMFNINECGAKPILNGVASLYMKKPGNSNFDNWGKMTAKIDFCKNLLLVTAKGGVKDYLPGVDVTVDGVLFGVADAGGGRGALMFAVNGEVKAGSFLNVTGQIALGINYNNNMNGVPNEVKEMYKTIPQEAKSGNNYSEMNGIVIKVNRTISSSGSNEFSAGPASLKVTYNVNQSTDVGLLANFATNSFKVNFGIGASFSGNVKVALFGYGADIGLNAYAYAMLTGGYNSSEGFNVRGDLYGGVSAKIGGCCDPGCNDWCAKAWFIGGCGAAKACVDFKASVGWSKRDGFNFYGISKR